MTDAELKPWLHKWVRVTLADGRVLAGKLAHTGSHYTVTTPPPDKRERETVETIQSGDQIATVQDAPEFTG